MNEEENKRLGQMIFALARGDISALESIYTMMSKLLYAIGNAIGGLFYDDYIVGSQLTAAVIWGRLAAQHAVGTLKKA